MRLSSALVILSLILLSASLSAYLLFRYMDVERDFMLAFGSMGLAIFLAISSGIGIVLFFFKKIRYRGEVFFSTLVDSVRQGAIFAILCIASVAFYALDIFQVSTVGLLASTLIFLELMISSMGEER